MYAIEERSIDDLMRRVVVMALSEGLDISPSKGPAKDLIGVQLVLANPLMRLSRTESRGRLFSGLGELAWYLSASAAIDFISYYLPSYSEFDEDGIAYGAYGPRIFGSGERRDQIRHVIDLLRRNPDSRKGVVQIFDALDIAEDHLDVPCTCALQFLVRNGKLNLVTYMRSNDIHKGLPHDIFSFTMLQELTARVLQLDLGAYYHFVGSLHLYLNDISAARSFLGEGWQSTVPMNPMPITDPWPLVDLFLEGERHLRMGGALR